jgi:hypothetical protein
MFKSFIINFIIFSNDTERCKMNNKNSSSFRTPVLLPCNHFCHVLHILSETLLQREREIDFLFVQCWMELRALPGKASIPPLSYTSALNGR